MKNARTRSGAGSTASRFHEEAAPRRLTCTELALRFEVEAADFEVEVMHFLDATSIAIIDIDHFDLPQVDDEASTTYDRRREQAYARIFEFLTRRALRALTLCEHPIPRPDGDEGELLATHLIRIRRESLPRGQKGDVANAQLRELEQWRNRFAAEQSYLVPVLVEKYLAMGVDRDDLVQEGQLGLLRAIDGYDWRRGVRFSTYAKYWIQDRVLKSLYDQSRTVRLPAWIQKLWQKAYRKAADPASGKTVVASEELAGELDVSKRRLERVVQSRRSQISLDASMPGNDDASFASALADPKTLDFSMPSDAESLSTSVHEVLAGLPARDRRILVERFGFGGQEPRSLKEIGDDLGISAERVRQIQAAAVDRLREDPRFAALYDTVA